jgi:hypothetical protein
VAPNLKIQFELIAWAAINRKGHYNTSHVHPMATWSGMYYVDPGDKPLNGPGAVLEFEHPIQAMVMKFSSLDAPCASRKPQDGRNALSLAQPSTPWRVPLVVPRIPKKAAKPWLSTGQIGEGGIRTLQTVFHLHLSPPLEGRRNWRLEPGFDAIMAAAVVPDSGQQTGAS